MGAKHLCEQHWILNHGLEHQLRGDCDGIAQCPVHRTPVREHSVDPFRCRSVLLIRLQQHPDVDAPDHEHALVILDFTHRLGSQPVNRR